MRFVFVALLITLQTPMFLFGQEDQTNRFEVGQRLQSLERLLDAQPDDAGRKRAVAPLRRATFLFLSGQTMEAGRMLDSARRAAASAKEPEPAILWAESLALKPSARLLDVGVKRIPITLAAFYGEKSPRPAKAILRLAVLAADGKSVAPAIDFPVDELPMQGELPFKSVAEGDYRLRAEIIVSDRQLWRCEQTLSLIQQLDKRLQALGRAVAALSSESPTADTETLRSLTQILAQLRQGKTLETNFPAAHLLAEAEAAAKAVSDNKGYFGNRRPGQFWMTIALEKRSVPVRLLAPKESAAGMPLPLVIALHGAGGSENLFFDGYGDGLIARLCTERGWLLVAPRGGLADGLIEQIDRLYPVDKQRIFLVGHSMGAAQAVAAAARQPENFAAVAALGGGGGIRQSDKLKTLPFFIGVGAEDFALSGARSLRDNLKRAEVKGIEYREYPDVEHLLVVQLALKEVFAFFDVNTKR